MKNEVIDTPLGPKRMSRIVHVLECHDDLLAALIEMTRGNPHRQENIARAEAAIKKSTEEAT